MKKFDVIIIGAGIAGLSSALSAVRSGMSAALVEKENYLGGTAHDCFHTYICGLFKNDDTTPFQIANPGLCSDIFNFLHACYGDKCLVKLGKVETLAFVQKDLWKYFDTQLNKNNFTFYKNNKCTKIVSPDKNIQKIQITTQTNKSVKLEADVFINATGCSTLSDTLEYHTKNSAQLGGYSILLSGKSDKDMSLIIPYTARKIVKKYRLENYLKFVTVTCNFLTQTHVLKFSVKESEDIEKCNFIYQELTRDIEELSDLKYLKSSKQIHLRSCNNTVNTVNTDEFGRSQNCGLECAAKSYWPSEKWDQDRGTQYQYIKKGKPFCIPVSALRDNKYDNLFLAGKNIRVPEHIHASARVMGVCIATGEQALINASKYLRKSC